jgi:hypothetical protein
MFLEAEFHAVWISSDGKIIDITPKVDNEDVILFLPDSKRIYDGRFVENRRKLLVLSEDGLRWLWLQHNRDLIRQRHFRNGEVDVRAAEEWAEWTKSRENTRLPNIRRNDPCLCGSGRKFKKCCGR